MLKSPTFVTRLSAAKLNAELASSPVDVEYHGVAKTPDILEGGALREGGAPDIYSKQHVGLLVHYFGGGMIFSIFYSIVYPFLNNYLRMSGIATASATVLISLPYTLQAFFGIISDCYPIFGYRRRPYMLIGWIVCAVCCLIMSVIPYGDPYYPDPDLAFVDPATLSEEVLATFNTDAPNQGTKFVLLLVVANLGIVFAFAASGGTLVELSQREPENVRGKLQSMIWVARVVGDMASSSLVGFGLNSADFAGSFEGSIGVHGLMVICSVVAIVTGASTWFNITEEKIHQRLSMRRQCAELFDLVQLRVVYYVLGFQLFKNMFANVGVTAAYPIQSVWAKVEPVNSSVAAILGSFAAALTFTAFQKIGLSWNWRVVIIVTQVSVVCIDMIPTFLTIWDVYRSQWFWLGVPILEQFPTCVGFVVSTFCMVEIIDGNNEASVYGLLNAVSSLAYPFSTVITKNMDAHFDIALERLQADDHAVRTQVTYAYLCQYALQLASLVFVVLLPRQKQETQALKREGGRSFVVGVGALVLFAFLFVWAVLTNLFSIFPSTACLVIAGGDGC